MRGRAQAPMFGLRGWVCAPGNAREKEGPAAWPVHSRQAGEPDDPEPEPEPEPEPDPDPDVPEPEPDDPDPEPDEVELDPVLEESDVVAVEAAAPDDPLEPPESPDPEVDAGTVDEDPERLSVR